MGALEKTVDRDAEEVGKEPTGTGFCDDGLSKTMGFCGPSSMDGESGPMRRDWASHPYCSLLGARRPDIEAIGGRTGLGVSTLTASDPFPDIPEKLCSNGLGSRSNFELACKYRMGLPPLTGAAAFSGFSSSAAVAMINGTEFDGEGGRSVKDIKREIRKRPFLTRTDLHHKIKIAYPWTWRHRCYGPCSKTSCRQWPWSCVVKDRRVGACLWSRFNLKFDKASGNG